MNMEIDDKLAPGTWDTEGMEDALACAPAHASAERSKRKAVHAKNQPNFMLVCFRVSWLRCELETAINNPHVL